MTPSITSAPDAAHDATTSPTTPPQTPSPPLPALTAKPVAYAGCCLALSAPLIGHLRSLLPPPPALVLSIGSGFGLLEAHLLAPPHSVHIFGVEVEPSPNRYLPPANHGLVLGTRFLEPLAEDAATWLFVYPRRVGLVSEYLAAHGRGAVRMVVWIGPQADWSEYESCFAGWAVQKESANEVGGRAWELIAVARRPA